MKSEKKPLISIIMNCFNGETYLKESIKSIISQTHTNWELIFWDNKSTDKSSEILSKFNDRRLKYFCADQHTTLYKARNLAIKKTQGEFITFLDTDDWWASNKLELQLKLFENKEINLVYGNVWWVYENSWRKKKKLSKINLPTGNVLRQILTNYKISIATTMIRKNAFYKSKIIFDDRYKIIGDFDLCIRLAAIWEFDCVQEPISFYRIHRKNYSSLNKNVELAELNNWYIEMQKHPILSQQQELKYVLKRIKYKKSLMYILQNNFFKGFIEFINYPIEYAKFKLLIILLIPKFILKKILSFGA